MLLTVRLLPIFNSNEGEATEILTHLTKVFLAVDPQNYHPPEKEPLSAGSPLVRGSGIKMPTNHQHLWAMKAIIDGTQEDDLRNAISAFNATHPGADELQLIIQR